MPDVYNQAALLTAGEHRQVDNICCGILSLFCPVMPVLETTVLTAMVIN